MISVTRIFRISMKVARWAEPHVKEWHRKRHFNRVEGQRNLDCRNWSEAEKHLTLALAERRHSDKRRCELLLNLEQAQRRQKKLTEAEQSALAAWRRRLGPGDRSLRARAQDALVDIQLEQASISGSNAEHRGYSEFRACRLQAGWRASCEVLPEAGNCLSQERPHRGGHGGVSPCR